MLFMLPIIQGQGFERTLYFTNTFGEVTDNGLKGVEIQRKIRADVLICDLIMPVQEGIETITQFREEFPDTAIIAISGGGKIGSESYLSVAEHLGAWKVFNKPVDMIVSSKKYLTLNIT